MVRPLHLFLDVDGVLADFDAHVAAMFEASPRELGDDRLWPLVEGLAEFWTSIPLKAGAMDIWAVARKHDPIFLTGCPRTGFDRAAAHKREWLRRHFGEVPVITCFSRDKARHLKAPGDILVDDRIANIKRWEKAGGRGIWYRDAEQTVRDLRQALRSESLAHDDGGPEAGAAGFRS